MSPASPPHWLDQLAPGGLILAPIAHGGVHPILAASHDGTVSAKAVLWADFMPAAGPLRPAELVGHDPADYLPPAPITRIPDASPARTTVAYHDLWFFLAIQDSRITRAYLDDDTLDVSKGACALHVPGLGTPWVQTDGAIAATGDPAVADELHALIRAWEATDRPALTQFTATFDRTGSPDAQLWVPHRWAPVTNHPAAAPELPGQRGDRRRHRCWTLTGQDRGGDALAQRGDLVDLGVAGGVAGELAQVVGDPAGADGAGGVQRGGADAGGFDGSPVAIVRLAAVAAATPTGHGLTSGVSSLAAAQVAASREPGQQGGT